MGEPGFNKYIDQDVILLTINRGGATAYFKPEIRETGSITRYVSSYYIDDVDIKSWREKRPDVAIIDTTTIPDDRIVEYALLKPMYGEPHGKIEEPCCPERVKFKGYGAFQYAPMDVVMDIAEEFGAKVYRPKPKSS